MIVALSPNPFSEMGLGLGIRLYVISIELTNSTHTYMEVESFVPYT